MEIDKNKGMGNVSREGDLVIPEKVNSAGELKELYRVWLSEESKRNNNIERKIDDDFSISKWSTPENDKIREALRLVWFTNFLMGRDLKAEHSFMGDLRVLADNKSIALPESRDKDFDSLNYSTANYDVVVLNPDYISKMGGVYSNGTEFHFDSEDMAELVLTAVEELSEFDNGKIWNDRVDFDTWRGKFIDKYLSWSGLV
jgi:hypothetical protein